jgi:uncharacterized caspase-like protein/tetratricopeptide (TPR) repeat protein
VSCRAVSAICVLSLAGFAQSPRDLKFERAASAASALPDGRTRWALVIGISAYQHVPPDFQLRYAHRDAEEFARFLRTTEGGGLSSTHIKLLTESGATLASIRAALRTWLPSVVGPDDIVYLFFAGHGVLAHDDRPYFVAHDSDPQNLHATALPFEEVDGVLSRQLKAKLVILLADACHSGSIGWSSKPSDPGRAQPALERIGAADRSFLKLLASRPSERSFEDGRWNGGHGVFTHAVLSGLRGAAERDKDGVVRASELIDYVSKYVPEQTGSQQNPRVAGNFEGALPLARLSAVARPAVSQRTNLRVIGAPGTSVYVNAAFRGTIRDSGELRISDIEHGPVRLSIDIPGEGSFEQIIQAASPESAMDLNKSAGLALMRIQGLASRGMILERGGALELYRAQSFAPAERAAAESAIAAGLEELGQNCVSDYVQSTAAGLKRAMLVKAAEAYVLLLRMRPGDKGIEMRQKFCLGRAQIAAGQFAAAAVSLRESLAIDPDFACAHNALGVAWLRLGRAREARQSFERAERTAPEWALPVLQVGQMLMAGGEPDKAVPYFEKSVRLQPRSITNRWSLLRAYRIAGHSKRFESQLADTLKVDPNYPPVYLEAGLHFKAMNNYERALQAMDTYLLLAPNYADSSQVQDTANELRKSLLNRK